MDKNNLQYELLLLLMSALWGSTFVAQQIGMERGLGPMTFNALRFTLGCLSLIPVIRWWDRRAPDPVGQRFPLRGSLVVGLYLLSITDGLRMGRGDFLILICAFLWTGQILVIDHVYQVDHFVRPGETLSSAHYATFAGGKGFNQSIALARAGAPTRHGGSVGRDSAWLLDRLTGEGVDITQVKTANAATGHAIIQVVPAGENAIVIHSGANAAVRPEDVERAVSSCSEGDYLLFQNETSSVAEAIRIGKRNGLKVVFNPAPMSPAVRDYPLHDVDLFILNETEAEGLTGQNTPEAVHAAMRTLFPSAAAVLTMGRKGAAYLDADEILRHPAIPVQAVDTTAAGDTFIGYFLAEMMRTGAPDKALALGCHAAAICVTRPGASDSIPFLSEAVEEIGRPRD